jgi:prefoldin subunit 5
MPQKKHRRLWLILNLFISTALIVLSILIVLNRQRIIDQINVWEFHSTAALDALVERAGMNSYGEFLYHASEPTLDGTQNFNSECARIENTVSILGCYTNSKIYIYDVTDPQLYGISEVTAAHETLHAAYDRLNVDEKNKVDVLLETEYAKLQNNPDYTDRMAFYARTEPGDRDNELNSVVGTEVANISPELESYYRQFFTDRQKSVSLYVKYNSVFKKLKQKADALASQLNSLTKTINNLTKQYNANAATLNSDIRVFNAKVNNSGFSSQSEFDEARAVLVERTSILEDARNTVNSDIKQYDSLLAEYNSNAAESNKLYNSIDSTLAPAPSV